jgi:hypothetical protein
VKEREREREGPQDKKKEALEAKRETIDKSQNSATDLLLLVSRLVLKN